MKEITNREVKERRTEFVFVFALKPRTAHLRLQRN